MATDFTNLQKLLDEQIDWPAEYLFKFICPRDSQEALTALIAAPAIRYRESKNGKYVSLTVRLLMKDSSAVVKLYQKAETIEGVVAV